MGFPTFRIKHRHTSNEGRVILHSDLNNFFASVECALNPSLRGHPVAVCGSVENRHGIVLAKNYLAKDYGVQTGEVIWQAKQKCPALVLVTANYENYMKYSRRAREIYADYTDRIEPFGADEAWLDLTGSYGVTSLSDGKAVADEIRNRIFSELGLTASVGVANNKIFAKLASDYKKPDATTVFSPDTYEDTVRKLPASDMIFVGRSTAKTLARYGIRTLGQLGDTSDAFIRSTLGKNGEALKCAARGEDTTEVIPGEEEDVIKSIGNSTTPPRDLENMEDVRAMCCMLAESVGTRLRAHGLMCNMLQITIRDSDLEVHEHRRQLEFPTDSTVTIAEEAYRLFADSYAWEKTVRSMGIRGGKLTECTRPLQLSLFDTEIEKREKKAKIDKAVDYVRGRYGYDSLQRGVLLLDRGLTAGNVKDESRVRCAFAQH